MVDQPSSLTLNEKHIDTNDNTVSTLNKLKISRTTDKELTVIDAPNKKRVRTAPPASELDSDDEEMQSETSSHAEYAKTRNNTEKILSKY